MTLVSNSLDLKTFDYVNTKEKKLVSQFVDPNTTQKKYILGINKFTKSTQKLIQIDGIIDDFTRVQKSRKKDILQIEDISSTNSIILWVSTGSPLEVKNKLNKLNFRNFSYLAFYRYSNLINLAQPPFICDFKEDFTKNYEQYKKVYNLLEDEKSKEIFEKVLNFKISFDYNFMAGFTNNHTEQYFDKEIIPKIDNIIFLDGGGYVGDTLPNIIDNFPNFKKIYLIEPNTLHINIAKRDFENIKNIEFINCGLGCSKTKYTKIENIANNCNHNYQAENIDTIDNILKEKIDFQLDFIKLDIEGAEQDAIDGAVNTIKKHHPILAICIYHKAQDWYKVPQKVLNIHSQYKIYIRHYMEGIYETVMYFIPNKS